MASDELVDIVDDDDRVVGTVTRQTMRDRHLRHRAVYIAVVGSDGRLLVHQRSYAKDVGPGWWDVAVGGVVTAGEGYDASAVREVAEEIGVRAGVGPHAGDGVSVLAPLGPVRYDDPSLPIIGRAYLLRHDGPFTFADGEVVATEWMTRAEVSAAVQQRTFCPDSLAVLFPLLGFPGTHIGETH